MQARASTRQKTQARPPGKPGEPPCPPCPPEVTEGRCTDCGRVTKPWAHFVRFMGGWRWLPGPDLCPECVDARQARELRREHREALGDRLAKAGFPPDLADWTFGRLWEAAGDYKRGEDLELWQRAWYAVKTWHGNKGALILRGPTGTGKTALAICAAKALAQERGLRPVYLAVPSLNDALGIKGRHPDKEAARGLLSAAIESSLPLIDDLAVGRLLAASQRGVGMLIDRALASGKPLIITTNAGEAEMARRLRRADPHGRLADRLAGRGTEVRLEGESFRRLGNTRVSA